MLLEQQSQPGGNVTQAFVHTICGLFEMNDQRPSYLHEGFPVSLSRKFIDDGVAVGPERVGKVFVQPIFPESMGEYLDGILRTRDSLEVRFNSEFLELEPEDEFLTVAIRPNGGSREKFRSEVVVDASGDAVTEPSPSGGDVDRVQLPSLIFQVEGIPEELTSGYGKLRLNRDVATGVKDGRLPEGCESILVRPGREPNQAYVTLNLPRNAAGQYNPFDPETLEDFEEEARRRARRVVEFLRDHNDELSEMTIRRFPERIGVRETNRVETRYTVTSEDVLEGRSFEGEVTRSAWPIELWNTYTDADFQYPEGPVGIPLDSLIARRDPRVGTAGRCMGATHRAAGALRVLGTALATGQAIGVAAALASSRGSSLAEVEPAAVRREIRTLAESDLF